MARIESDLKVQEPSGAGQRGAPSGQTHLGDALSIRQRAEEHRRRAELLDQAAARLDGEAA